MILVRPFFSYRYVLSFLGLHAQFLASSDKKSKQKKLRGHMFLTGENFDISHAAAARESSNSFRPTLDCSLLEIENPKVIENSWVVPRKREQIKLGLLQTVQYVVYLHLKKSLQKWKRMNAKKSSDMDEFVLNLVKAKSVNNVRKILRNTHLDTLCNSLAPSCNPSNIIMSAFNDIRFLGIVMDFVFHDSRLLPIARALEKSFKRRATSGSFMGPAGFETHLVSESFVNEWSQRYKVNRKRKRSNFTSRSDNRGGQRNRGNFGNNSWGGNRNFRHPGFRKNFAQSNSNSQKPCFDFIKRGTCNFGNRCRFKHFTPSKGSIKPQ